MVVEHAAATERHRARPHGQSRRGCGPRRRPVCRLSAGARRPRRQRHAGLTITNVNSHSLGVEGIAPETLRKTNVILIPRNTPLPAKATKRFATKSENQRSIAVQILEGESSLPGECTAIGRTVIRDLPEGLPKNWPIEVTFEYAANGRLKVRAAVPGTRPVPRRSTGTGRGHVGRRDRPLEAADRCSRRLRCVRIDDPGCGEGGGSRGDDREFDRRQPLPNRWCESRDRAGRRAGGRAMPQVRPSTDGRSVSPVAGFRVDAARGVGGARVRRDGQRSNGDGGGGMDCLPRFRIRRSLWRPWLRPLRQPHRNGRVGHRPTVLRSHRRQLRPRRPRKTNRSRPEAARRGECSCKVQGCRTRQKAAIPKGLAGCPAWLESSSRVS